MVIITEDNVSKHILSYTRDNFLFTRTVCKVWYKNGAETNSKTNHLRAVDSPSTFDEAFQSGWYLDESFGTYTLALMNESDISVFTYFLEEAEFELSDEEKRWSAAFGRVDVLQLYRKNGTIFDEKFVHEAVNNGHLETLTYLMSVGCPVDSKLIDWEFRNVCEELKKRSMELAVEDGRIDIVKQLRTVDYPFTWDTFKEAIFRKDIGMLKYLKENADGEFEDPYDEDLSNFMEDNDYESVKMLLNNDLVRKYRDGDLDFGSTHDYDMIKLFEFYGYRVCARLIDNLITDQYVEFAKDLVEEYKVFPTSFAYDFVYQDCESVIEGIPQDEWLVKTLNWLYDGLGIKWDPKDLSRYVEVSPEVKQWFYDRCT